MNELNLIDKDLQNTIYQDCTISILLASDGYCLSIKDCSKERFMALKTFPGTYSIEDVKLSVEELEAEIWGNIVDLKVKNLIYATKNTIVVPQTFSDPAQLNDIMKFHFPSSIDCKIQSEEFKSISIAFLVNNSEFDNYINTFKPHNIHNMAMPLIKTALKYAESQDEDAVHVQVWGDYIDMVVIKNKSLALFNTYRCKSGNDMVYFILNAYKQLVLNPQTCSLMLSGWIVKNDNSIIQLNKFIKRMYFETLNPELKYSFHFQDSLPHYFIHFLNID
jgi:hypothetical protein